VRETDGSAKFSAHKIFGIVPELCGAQIPVIGKAGFGLLAQRVEKEGM